MKVKKLLMLTGVCGVRKGLSDPRPVYGVATSVVGFHYGGLGKLHSLAAAAEWRSEKADSGLPDNGADQSSRKAVTTGRRAARHAGNRPPRRPINSEYIKAWPSSPGVTAKANATWLNDWKFMVDVW